MTLLSYDVSQNAYVGQTSTHTITVPQDLMHTMTNERPATWRSCYFAEFWIDAAKNGLVGKRIVRSK